MRAHVLNDLPVLQVTIKTRWFVMFLWCYM